MIPFSRHLSVRELWRGIAPLMLIFGWSPLNAEEGMWTFDYLPMRQLQALYNCSPTQEWLDHIRLASVRFNDGGSGSFVSAAGLVLTNHHVARGQLQKMSSPAKDYVKDGFLAPTQADEIKCPDLELNVLVSFEDVTKRVLNSTAKGKTNKEALELRKAAIAEIEKESLDSSGFRSDVVTLYAGGEYWLYRYTKYTDVRIVFAPEVQIAFFGGDPDNFTYPRHDLDMAIFRVYENDKPVRSEHYLKWSAEGAADGELVFVSGHPGSTSRMKTLSQLEWERDQALPFSIKYLEHRLEFLQQYAQRGPEQQRQITAEMYGVVNSLKALRGNYSAILDKSVMASKQQQEKEFRETIAKDPKLLKEYGGAWDDITRAAKNHAAFLDVERYRTLRGANLASRALTIVRYVNEIQKPDGVRLEGFHDSQLESLRFRLLSPAPVYPELEEARLADVFQFSLGGLGASDPFIKAVLGGKSPASAAREIITQTQLAKLEVRIALLEGGKTAVDASTDPLILLAKQVDPFMREWIKQNEEKVESIEAAAEEKLGKARFAVYGKTVYPDATFTLRLSYGTVKGFPMNGTKAPSHTTFYGLYDRANAFNMQGPFALPDRYLKREKAVDLATPLNFVTNNDVVGGNSGSPVINKNAELVGLVFDGNIESLLGDFFYNETNNRTVAVHSKGMLEALRKLYDAGKLADQLQGK